MIDEQGDFPVPWIPLGWEFVEVRKGERGALDDRLRFWDPTIYRGLAGNGGFIGRSQQEEL